MEAAAARDTGVLSSYVQELKSLRNNDGESIQFLSSIASENRHLAKEFVAVIEEHINKVDPGSKLWGLYLMDSIVKNCKDFYKNPFSRNLVEVFLPVYDQAPRELKQKLHKLLTVWKDQGRFERRLVEEITAQVRKRDGGGGGSVPPSPAKPLVPAKREVPPTENTTKSQCANNKNNNGAPPPPQLTQHQPGMGGYQQQQTYSNNPNQASSNIHANMQQASSVSVPPVAVNASNLMSQLQKSGLLQTLANMNNSSNATTTTTTTTKQTNHNSHVKRSTNSSFPQNRANRNHSQPSMLKQQHKQVLKAEILLSEEEEESKSDTEEDRKAALAKKKKTGAKERSKKKKEVPVEYSRAYLRTRHEGVINSFYFDQTHQCMQTGKRFKEKSRLQRHLDLVYQRKKLMREDTLSRKWFVKLEQWKHSISSACIQGGNEEEDERKDAKTKAPTIDDILVSDPSKLELSVAADPKATRCPLSGEKFKVFYSDKYDSWRYQDAVVLVKSYQELPKGTIVSISALPAEQRPGLVDIAMIPNSNKYAPGPSAKRQKLN